ncbi:winged helix-turn-helix domain-containing protein [Streptomyces sp. NPDC058308]|uniref:winged helix-turn-helix domain-containing protein n=1 Tax=Streptomyces sp. NPDC058308 TaxID=3346440 RepID=UPI0036E12F4A
MIAKELRVNVRSVERWRRAWCQDGTAALASAGPPKLPKLTDDRFAELEQELARGSAVHGWEDQRWTLARIRVLIFRQFALDVSPAAVWRLLHRHGWSWQSPACRAIERDEHAVELWKKDVWPQADDCGGAGSLRRLRGRGRFGMTSSRARTWGRRGQTPVVRVRGRSWRRYSIAALCCCRPPG